MPLPPARPVVSVSRKSQCAGSNANFSIRERVEFAFPFVEGFVVEAVVECGSSKRSALAALASPASKHCSGVGNQRRIERCSPKELRATVAEKRREIVWIGRGFVDGFKFARYANFRRTQRGNP